MPEIKNLFEKYSRHYMEGSEHYFMDPASAASQGKNRVPRWMRDLPRDLRILDAGCADGYMLAALQHAGFESLTGVDISEEMTSLARKRLGGGAIITASPIKKFLEETQQDFDIILFHHVLEHMPRDEGIEVLTLMYQRLRPAGHLSIRTPNANTLAAGYHCHGDHTHLVAFNERSLLQALEFAGFCAEHTLVLPKKPEYFFSLKHPIRTMARMLNILRWRLNRLLHQAIYLIGDLRPLPKSFDWELELIAQKREKSDL